MSATAIQWAQEVWNAIVGCTRVSQGCMHCYAEVMAWRHVLMCRALGRRCKYEGTVELVGGKPRWTGVLNFDEASLDLPLRTRTPKTWFVDSMSDLFHEKVLDQWLDRMFAVMALCPQHRFLILTKRPERMRTYFDGSVAGVSPTGFRCPRESHVLNVAQRFALDNGHSAAMETLGRSVLIDKTWTWPMPHVWLGVSVEDQATADERIPLLLHTPAAVRFVSAEPLLGPVDLTRIPWGWRWPRGTERERVYTSALVEKLWFYDDGDVEQPRLDLVIPGLESGHGARAGDVAWIRALVGQCKAAGVPCFVKQLGAVPMMAEFEWKAAPKQRLLRASNRDRVPPGFVPLFLRDRKGGDMSEWPEDLRVREFPA